MLFFRPRRRRFLNYLGIFLTATLLAFGFIRFENYFHRNPTTLNVGKYGFEFDDSIDDGIGKFRGESNGIVGGNSAQNDGDRRGHKKFGSYGVENGERKSIGDLKDLHRRLIDIQNRIKNLGDSDRHKTKALLELRYRIQHFLSSITTSTSSAIDGKITDSDQNNRRDQDDQNGVLSIDQLSDGNQRADRQDIAESMIDRKSIDQPIDNPSIDQSAIIDDDPWTSTNRTKWTLNELYRRGLIQNSSNTSAALLSIDLSIPAITDYLPHLSDDPLGGLIPKLRISKNRRDAQLVIGIPTIRRPDKSYLHGTLRSLIENLPKADRKQVLIVVFVAEVDGLTPQTLRLIESIESEFRPYIADGLIELLLPSPTYYPDFDRIPATFDDSPERMRWRTKQNLDYAYLMMYAKTRGRFYLQLEDDIITKPNYYEKILTHLRELDEKHLAANSKNSKNSKNASSTSWYLVEYSSLGFIGKLFRTRDLSTMIEFIFIFYKDKPVDWLLDNLFYVRFCSPEKGPKECQRTKQSFRIRYKPSLFQHVGVQSSLRGKVQKLREKDFGRNFERQAAAAGNLKLFSVHTDNPKAEVSTSLKSYQQFDLERAYDGEGVFWGLLPQMGDWILIKFTPPIRMEGFTIRTGTPENPIDIFYNTSVQLLFVDEMAPNSNSTLAGNSNISLTTSNTKSTQHQHSPIDQYERTEDGYRSIARFDQDGLANRSIQIDTSDRSNLLPKVDTLRIYVHSESTNWVIISEIHIRVYNETD